MRAARAVGAGVAGWLALALAGCGAQPTGLVDGRVAVVAAENEYGDVVSQIGGPYVTVTSVDSNPNTDPHTYEATQSVARDVAEAGLLVANGVGYDSFLDKLASASPNPHRRSIDVGHLLGLPDDTPNPHLWYSPTTMPAVAAAVAGDLEVLAPAHAGTFRANEARFVTSLDPWLAAISSFKAHHRGVRVATTEPVADYLLTAMGIDDLTPFGFQADIMNGVDPSPQDVATEDGFFTGRRVQVFCYNQQVTDTLTNSIRATALRSGVSVVGVYETMPTPGYDYQSWMVAEVAAIERAVTTGRSTEKL